MQPLIKPRPLFGTSMYHVITRRGGGTENGNLLLCSVLKVITKGRGRRVRKLKILIEYVINEFIIPCIVTKQPLVCTSKSFDGAIGAKFC